MVDSPGRTEGAPKPGVGSVSADCPLCDQAGPHPVLLPVRHLSPFNPRRSPPCRLAVVRCARCGLLRLDPRPDDATLERLQAASLGDAEKGVGSFEAGNENPDYAPMLAARLRDAGFPERDGKLLDVGCGGGELVVAVAGELGAAATGLDVSEAPLSRARRRFPGSEWILGRVEPPALPPATFDGAAMIHVLEHLLDPVGALRVVRSWVRPGGLLAVEVPNGEFYFSRLYTIALESPKRLFAAWFRALGRRVPFTARGFYPFHLTLFGSDSLRATAERAGLDVLSLTMSTSRLEWWLKENRRQSDWPRWAVNRLKLGLARRGLGDNLLLIARRPASESAS